MKLISEQWSDDVNYLFEEDPKTGKRTFVRDDDRVQWEWKPVEEDMSDWVSVKGIAPKFKNQEELLNDKQKIGLKHYEDILKRIPRSEIASYETKIKSTSHIVFGNIL